MSAQAAALPALDETARRPRVTARAAHEASLLRLTSALLCEQNDEWRASKMDLDMNPAHPPLA